MRLILFPLHSTHENSLQIRHMYALHTKLKQVGLNYIFTFYLYKFQYIALEFSPCSLFWGAKIERTPIPHGDIFKTSRTVKLLIIVTSLVMLYRQ